MGNSAFAGMSAPASASKFVPHVDHTSDDKQTDTVGSAARTALEKHSGDSAKAMHELVAMVRKDQKLRMALLEPLIEYACGNAIRSVIQDNRDRVWNSASNAGKPSQREQMMSIAKANLMIFPLPGGKMLGDATRAEVIEAASFYAKQAKNMAHKARWLKLVHDEMPEDKKVNEVFAEANLLEMMGKVS